MNKKNPPKTVIDHNNYAEDYDYLSLQYENHSSEIIFGLAYEYIKPRDKLLDIGIGTGLSSALFKEACLEIYGLDNSQEMLEICKQKNIAFDLKLFDLNESFLPYNNLEFNHIIAVGVFHFFHDLEKFFRESYRILKEGGTFSFIVKHSKKEF